jgi:hypothetical protein
LGGAAVAAADGAKREAEKIIMEILQGRFGLRNGGFDAVPRKAETLQCNAQFAYEGGRANTKNFAVHTKSRFN